MKNDVTISIHEYPDKKSSFCGFCVPEPCACCGETDNSVQKHVIEVDGRRTVLCADCLEKLYVQAGRSLRKSVSLNDVLYELIIREDGSHEVFPMTVKSIAPYGELRRVKGREPSVWNIYAESEYTYMYKSFHDIGRTVFFTEDEAHEAASGKAKG